MTTFSRFLSISCFTKSTLSGYSLSQSRSTNKFNLLISLSRSIGNTAITRGLIKPQPSFIMTDQDNDQQLPNSTTPGGSILNTNTPVSLERLRQEFSRVGGGKFELSLDNNLGIAELVINNVTKRNSLSGSMMAQMDDILSQLESWKEGRAVIIRGKDNFFCSGGDLTTVREITTHEGGRQMNILMQDNLSRLQNLPLITCALIEGKAIGGGAEICTAADFRIMAPNSEIGFVHIKMGITAGWGGGARLVQLIGPTRALELMATGKRLNPKDALEYGLISDIIQDQDKKSQDDGDKDLNMIAAKKWIAPLIAGPAEPLRAIKEIVNAAKMLPLEEALKREEELFSSVWGGPAHKQAMAMNVKHK